ncbi:G protein-coupled receptor 184 [Denticeps clupeoides]|nr:G-protein coupled receptor 4-like [Denticeps clupeoides]XP_028817737.1 G-protein coupled receptor 4-like [Denticeps clupeoides]
MCPNSSANSSDTLHDNREMSNVLMSVYILVFIFGLVFNLLTFAPIVQQIRRKNVLGVYLICLSISDIFYIGTMPLWIYYYRNNHQWLISSWSCSLSGFFYYTNMYSSIYFLCCISVDRCVSVSFPLHARSIRRLRTAWIICLVIFSVTVALHVIILLNGKDNGFNSVTRTCYEAFPISTQQAIFNLLRVGFGFCLPLLILVPCYTQIWAKAKASVGLDEHSKQKLKRLVVGVIVIFSICFLPYHALLLTRSLYKLMDEESYCATEKKLHGIFSASLALCSLNSMVDPVLYMLASTGIQEDMRICYRMKREKAVTIRTISTKP